MSEFLLNDERAFRTCILYEAVTETPVEEAYKRLKELKPNLDYLDFEYWYFRFLNGNEDLDHDKSKDTNNHQFSDIPTDVVERIVGKLNAMDRLSLRKVSRTLRTIVDGKRFPCESVRLRCGDKTSELSINNNKSIKYKHVKKGFTDLAFERFSRKNVEGCHWEMAMNDLSSFFLNPNWTFKTVKMELSWHGFTFPFSDNSKIHVEDLDISSGSMKTMVAILPYLNSDVLRKIRFWTTDFFSDIHLETIVTMDQWKNAEELHFKIIPDWFDIKNLFHTKKFTSMKFRLTEDRLETIRDILFKSPTFEYCSLRDERDYEYFNHSEVISLMKKVMGADDGYDPDDIRYPIDDSDDYFKISCKQGSDEDVGILFLEIKRIRA